MQKYLITSLLLAVSALAQTESEAPTETPTEAPETVEPITLNTEPSDDTPSEVVESPEEVADPVPEEVIEEE